MAPGRKRGAKGLKTKSELSLGDLVLAKVKGFPAWPAKISRPEDWKHAPDSKKYFVQFFGTLEIAFVAPADIQAFTSEYKNKLSARCQGKTVKHFSQAVKEICEEFELLQRKKFSSTINDDNGRNIASVSHSVDPVVDEILEDSGNCGMDSEEPNSELEIKVECQYVKPCSLDDMNYGLSPHLSSGRRNKLSTNLSNFVKESVNGFRDIKAGDWGTDGGQGSLANSAQTRLAIGLKRNHDPANGRNRDSIVLREHIGDGLQTNLVSGGQKKASSAEISRSDLDVGSKKFLKEKTYMPALDDDKMDAEAIFDGNTEIIPRKKMKFHNDYEHHISRANEAPFPAKMDNIDLKRLTSGVKADNLEVQPSSNESNHSTDEDDLPPIKRHRRALGVVSSSSLMSQNRSGNSASQKSGLVYPKKVQSSIMQPTTKRRAVRLCDEDDDELPKTPIHSGFARKVSVVPCVSDSRKKSFKREESYTNGQVVVRNLGRVEDKSKEHAQSSLASDKASSPAAQKSVKKRTTESSVNSCHSPTHLVIEKNSLMEAKPVIVSPKMSPHPVTATKADPQKKHFGKLPDCISPRKVLPGPGANKATTSERLTSNLNQSISERSKPTSSVERRKSTPKSELKIYDPVLLVGNPDESINSSGERIDVGKDTQTSLPIDLTISDPGMSMKHLIAAAQARKRQSNLQNSNGNPRRLIPDADMNRQSPSVIIATSVVESSNSLQIKVQGHPTSSPPSHDGHQLSSVNEHDEDLEERRASSGHQASGSSLSGGTEASVARDAFEGMIETLSRTKESIGRATRLAIDCAKFGIANEIVELLIQKLENEPSFHRKVDLFFLVDSITQCSHSQRGIAGASYIPIVQAALPRLIGAAAPTGTGTQENRRQCHKVLRLWLERNILPEYVLRPFMDDIRAMNDNSSAGFCQRRPSRDRPINDPIREMEGMFVDEYGSNATFQLPGLLPSHLFEEEEEEEDEDNFPIKLCKEVINSSPGKDHENYTVTPSDRRHCILEEVDGELEMEDVSGHQKDERLLIASDTPLLEPKLDVNFISSSTITSTMLPSPDGSPPLPPGSPPVTPPLPTSPPPLSPPPPTSPPPPPPSSPPPPPSSSPQHPFPPPVDPPRFSQLLPPQPVLMSQYMLPFPSTMLSQSIAYHLTPTLHEISITSSGNQASNMVSNTQVSNISAPIRSEVFSKQPSFLSPAAVSSAREHASYNSLRIEHGQGDACMKPHAPQQRQQFLMGNASFGQRTLCPEPPQIPSHFSYSNLVHLYQPYSYLLPNHSDGSRICAVDEHRKMPLNDFSADRPSSGWMTGGNFGPPPERALANTVKVQPPVANSQPPAPSVPGAPLMPSRPDMSADNWRPT